MHDLDVLAPVDEAGRFYPEYGWLHGLSTVEAAEQIVGDLGDRGLLVRAETIEHSYPVCWRCHTPLIFRLSDDWFIAVDELRQPLLDANATVEWTPAYMGKRMDDWLRNMGDWNISRRRYYGLPLPFYPCCVRAPERDRLAGRARGAGARRPRPARGAPPTLDRRRADPLRGLRRGGASGSRRSATSGSTPASSRSRRSAGRTPSSSPRGTRPAPRRGLTTADLPDHATWEQWFPADWVSEMREQIRLWFYSQLLMSVALTGRAPFKKVLGYEKMLDEHGKEMHGSWGNMIDAEDAFARMGADVMRWQYCAQPPDRNLLFGFGPAQEIKRRLLTLWNSAKFLARLRRDRVVPSPSTRTSSAEARTAELQPLDRWLVERTAQLVEEAEAGYERWLTVDVTRAFDAFVDDLSNWYIRRSRRRFWDGDETALRSALVRARPGAAGDRAGDAVPRRAPLAGPRRGRRRRRPELGVPRRLARGPSAGRRAARRGRRAAEGRRARAPGAVGRPA